MSYQEYRRLPRAEDEVDVIAVFAAVSLFFRKHWKGLVVFSAFGAVLGGLLWFLVPVTYESKMVLDSRVLNSEEIARTIESWQELVKYQEHEMLAKALNIPVAQASKIDKVELTRSLNANPESGTTSTKYTFEIKAVVHDAEVLQPLERGILQRLRSNEYALGRINAVKDRLIKLKAKTQEEIAQLDSTRLAINNIIRAQKASAFITDPGNINIRLVELYEKMLALDEQIQFIDNVQVVQHFGEFAIPVKAKLSLHIIAGVVLGFVIGLVYVFMKKLRRYIAAMPVVQHK
jgi:hypothetical protein